MFAMVTPPVLFFAHALSNYSEVFNKINTFFQKNETIFRVFFYSCGQKAAWNTIYGGCGPAAADWAEGTAEKRKIPHWGNCPRPQRQNAGELGDLLPVKGDFYGWKKDYRHYFAEPKLEENVEIMNM